MSNRTDWKELTQEIVDDVLKYRIETELHNAFVAGQEHENELLKKQVSRMRTALQAIRGDYGNVDTPSEARQRATNALADVSAMTEN